MAIISGNPDGVQVGTSAANGVLGSQAAAANNEIIIPSSLLVTNNGDIEVTIEEPGRLIMIRKGTATEEQKYCSGAVGTTLTVHEDWIIPPVATDTYDISYIIQDAATVTGLTLVNKRVNDYSAGRFFKVLTGGWMAFLNGVSFETHNKTDPATPVFEVQSGGYFSSGYLANEFPVSGSTIISTADVTGDYGIAFQDGTTNNLYDLVITSVQQNKLKLSGDTNSDSVKFFNVCYDSDITNDNGVNNTYRIIIEGKAQVTDTLLVNQYTNIDEITVIATNGFITLDDAVVETMTIKNARILDNNTRFVLVNDNKTWKFINPLWEIDTATQDQIAFEVDSANSVEERFTFTSAVQSPTGEGLPLSSIYLYEDLTTQSITYSSQSNAQLKNALPIAAGTGYVVDDILTLTGGTFSTVGTIKVLTVGGGGDILTTSLNSAGSYTILPSDPVAHTGGTGTGATFDATFESATTEVDVLTRTFTDNAGTSLTVSEVGNFALKTYNYGKTPFVTAIEFTKKLDQSSILVDDGAISEAVAATAITTGSGAGVNAIRHGTGETDIRPMKVLGYDAGTGTVPTLGETITSGSATGDLVEFLGDEIEGVLVLENWNGTEFTNNTAITGATFAATTDTTGDVASFYEEYTWQVTCNTASVSTAYDYLAARMAEFPITALYEQVLIWGTDEQSQLLYSSPSGYYTQRNIANTEGVWVSNRGAGDVAYFTSDSGATYIPPASVTFSFTGLQPNTEVKLFTTTGRNFVAGTDSSGTSFSYTYNYTVDQSVYAVVFHINYKDIRLINLTLGSTDQSIPIQQQTDRNYSNP